MSARGAVVAGATTALLGSVVSGPVALGILAVTRPQPEWIDSERFVEAFHPIQSLPYLAGFFLVGGFVVLVVGLHELAGPQTRARTGCAVAFVATFAAMIFANYALQTTLVPTLVSSGDPADRSLLAWTTMANPRSFGWGL